MTTRPSHLALVSANGSAAPAHAGCRHVAVWRASAVERVLPAGANLVCVHAAGGEVIWLETELVRELYWQVEHPRQSWPDAVAAAGATSAELNSAPDARNVAPPAGSLTFRDHVYFVLACLAAGGYLAWLAWSRL